LFGFGVGTTYDRTLSSEVCANGTILGQGGLLDAAGGFLSDIDDKNYLGAIQKAGTAYNTFKNVNLIKKAVEQELLTGLQNSLNNSVHY